MKKRCMKWLAVVSLVLLATGTPLRASETDDRIKASARSSYVFQTYLTDDAIEIESKDGVVVLTGTVLDEPHRALAQETVASLPGVKSVDNRLELKGARPTENPDAWIASKVKTALLFRRNVNAYKTDVSVKDGIVTLRGNAANQEQVDLTTEYAENVDGVKEVRNEMTLSQTPKETYETTMRSKIDDASITAQVKMALLFHRTTSVLNTKVDTEDGTVTVSGLARNTAERDLVSKLVNDIKGVKTVKNEMTVEKSR